MENAKNSFYIALRDRIGQGNPSRTIFVRGVSRPAVLLEDNELTPAQEKAFLDLLEATARDAAEQALRPYSSSYSPASRPPRPSSMAEPACMRSICGMARRSPA